MKLTNILTASIAFGASLCRSSALPAAGEAANSTLVPRAAAGPSQYASLSYCGQLTIATDFYTFELWLGYTSSGQTYWKNYGSGSPWLFGWQVRFFGANCQSFAIVDRQGRVHFGSVAVSGTQATLTEGDFILQRNAEIFSKVAVNNAGNLVAKTPDGHFFWYQGGSNWAQDNAAGKISDLDYADAVYIVQNNQKVCKAQQFGAYTCTTQSNFRPQFLSVSSEDSLIYVVDVNGFVWTAPLPLTPSTTFGQTAYVVPGAAGVYHPRNVASFPYILDQNGNVWWDQDHQNLDVSCGKYYTRVNGVCVPATGVQFYIQQRSTGKHLADNPHNSGQGAQWIVENPSNGANEIFTFNSQNQITVATNGLCITVDHGNSGVGTAINQWGCRNPATNNQIWFHNSLGQFTPNFNGNVCLSINGNTQTQIDNCANPAPPSQVFDLIAVGPKCPFGLDLISGSCTPAPLYLVQTTTGLRLSAPEGGQGWGGQYVAVTPKMGTSEVFQLNSQGNLVNAGNGLCMTVDHGYNFPGAAVNQWGCASGHANQIFKYNSLGQLTPSYAANMCVSINSNGQTVIDNCAPANAPNPAQQFSVVFK